MRCIICGDPDPDIDDGRCMDCISAGIAQREAYAEQDNAIRAATQEQPAGSGATLDRERCEGLYLKFSEPMMEPHTPVIIERVNGDCTVSQFIIARDEAHELINQLSEFLRVGSPRKVGEDGNKVNNLSEKWRQSCSVGPLFKDGTLEPVDVREGVLRCADELEVSLKSLGRACAKKARQLGFDVGDGDWWDTDEIVVGLLRAGRERALAGVAEQVRILKSMAEQCNERGMAETPQKEWTPYQGKISAYDCVLGLLERAARPSSVPVGEQKQEEGV